MNELLKEFTIHDNAGHPAPPLPSGTLTFLFTDVEGSTRLWEQHREDMRGAMARHDELIEATVAQHHGAIVRPRAEGDSRFAVFPRATDAIAAASAIQRALSAEPWTMPSPLRVRMALHTGEAELRDGDYYGPAVNRCARLRSAAHGGQTLVSMVTHSLVQDVLPDGAYLRDLGEHNLKDLKRPEHIFQLIVPGRPSDFPALKVEGKVRNNLPITLTRFIGRETEMNEVKGLVKTTPLLTITGAGKLAYQQGDYIQAKSMHSQSLALFREMEDQLGIARQLDALGEVAQQQGDYQDAFELHTESLRLNYQRGDKLQTVRSLNNLGLVAQFLCEYERAFSLQQENQQGITNCLGAIAGLASMTGQPTRSARLFAAVDKLRQTMSMRMGKDDQHEYEECLSQLQDQMDEATFRALWSEGSAMGIEQVVHELASFGKDEA